MVKSHDGKKVPKPNGAKSEVSDIRVTLGVILQHPPLLA